MPHLVLKASISACVQATRAVLEATASRQKLSSRSADGQGEHRPGDMQCQHQGSASQLSWAQSLCTYTSSEMHVLTGNQPAGNYKAVLAVQKGPGDLTDVSRCKQASQDGAPEPTA